MSEHHSKPQWVYPADISKPWLIRQLINAVINKTFEQAYIM